MIIDSIRLQNFRNYKDSSFDLGPRVNLIVGPNAIGKTNLLESILVLASGSSYRAKDADLIKNDESWSRLDGLFSNDKRIVKIETDSAQTRKTFELGDKVHKRLGFDDRAPVVLFEPNHLNLITRGPEQRRDYIDELLAGSQRDARTIINKYRRALAQRNSLLKKHGQHSAGEIFVWNIRLSELGAQLALARSQLIDQINKVISKSYSSISGTSTIVELEYASHFPVEGYASKMITRLDKETELDFIRGFTAYGPHREDIIFKINQKPIAQIASRGEARSVVLALKIFELGLYEQARGAKPLFLLDDVFSELDSERRKSLVQALEGHQTILTTTDADEIKKYFKPNQVKLIRLSAKPSKH